MAYTTRVRRTIACYPAAPYPPTLTLAGFGDERRRARELHEGDRPRHSDKEKTFCPFNADPTLSFSEWPLIAR
jgi:hypothetical protein